MSAIADDAAFTDLTGPYRRELHVHSYRMLGSFEEAEDAVQETYLRAWRSRDSFDGSAALRAWLYKIATNVCLDAIRRANRRPPGRSLDSIGEVPWIGPYPDRLLDEIAPPETEPDKVAVARETIELAFLAAVQLLPPRQRAVLILRDVVDWSARETAEQLDMTVTAVNSALQRARATMAANRPHGRTAAPPPRPTEAEMELVRRAIGRTNPRTWKRWPRCSATTFGSRCRRRRSGSTAGKPSCRACRGPDRRRRVAARADPR